LTKPRQDHSLAHWFSAFDSRLLQSVQSFFSAYLKHPRKFKELDMSDCLFCKIIAGEIPAPRVYSDDQVIVIPDINPKAPVHLLVIPRQHLASLDALTPAEDGLIAHLMRLLPKLAREQGLPNGFRTIINTGRGGGQEIFHLHIHLLGGTPLPGF
jgi:histidine triad (HIT) family protein